MNKESFLETIRQQFSDEILEVYNECAHGGQGVDVPQLNQRLNKMMAHAKHQGLSHAEFEELVKMLLPSMADQVQLGVPAAQAA